MPRTIVVTGGSSGLGAAIATRLARSGSRIVVTARNGKAGEAVVDRIRAEGGDAEFFAQDVGEAAQWRALLDAILARHGRLDAVVNNAGIASTGPIESFDAAQMRRMLRTNLLGGVLGTQLPAAVMAAGGCIVNIASVAGRKGYPFSSAYCMSKGALCAFTHAAAAQLRERGLRVHLVVPGFYDTPLGRREAMPTPEIEQQVLSGVPLRRVGRPDELAATVEWLLSTAAAGFSGLEITADGGVLA
ncbi:MAG TPA: SDR family oxidoreductase [Nevskiaceae bacterium]|nr:SDR family oxidoreductase [Nevskiaceae bacterium]